jgi:hypothetical protein
MFDVKFREVACPDPRRVPLRGTAVVSPHMGRVEFRSAGGGPAWLHDEPVDRVCSKSFELAHAGRALMRVDKPLRLSAAEPGRLELLLRPVRSVRKVVGDALASHHGSYAYYEGNAPGRLDIVETVRAAVWLPNGVDLLYMTDDGVYRVTLDTLSRMTGSIGYWHITGELPFNGPAPGVPRGEDRVSKMAGGLDGRELSLAGGPLAGRRISEAVKLINL